MTTIIKKKIKKGISSKKFSKALSTKGVDTKKYCGVIKLAEDPSLIQKKLRNEWE
jgi:hypothetical protein